MRVRFLVLATWPVVACGPVFGPTKDENKPADEGKPSSTNIDNAQYPRVHADGRATFPFRAPDARKVPCSDQVESLTAEDPDEARYPPTLTGCCHPGGEPYRV